MIAAVARCHLLNWPSYNVFSLSLKALTVYYFYIDCLNLPVNILGPFCSIYIAGGLVYLGNSFTLSILVLRRGWNLSRNLESLEFRILLCNLYNWKALSPFWFSCSWQSAYCRRSLERNPECNCVCSEIHLPHNTPTNTRTTSVWKRHDIQHSAHSRLGIHKTKETANYQSQQQKRKC